MNFKDRFLQISEFLAPYKSMWVNEIIELYPDGLEAYPREWIELLDTLDDDQLYRLDCLSDYGLIENSELGQWMKRMNELCQVQLKEIPETENLPDWAFNKVKGKKRHEILILAEVLKEIQNDKAFSHLVDIGGGVGHLARVMAHYKGIECISLDINQEFQELGKKRLEKYPKPPQGRDVKFITHDFTHELEGEMTKKIFTKDSFSLGLHTCGPLAIKHIDCALKNQTRGLLNFGCCYNRLDPESDINISDFAKAHGQEGFNTFTFTLASRGHSSMTKEDFIHKRRVKDYRYALHIYFHDILGIKELIPVGDSHHREYWKDFGEYALSKIEKIGMETQWKKEDFDKFFAQDSLQKSLNQLFKANIIRWQLGRTLELYILLDRILYIEQSGKKAQLLQFFSSDLSPRNIGVLYTE
ncbi:methyltransferase [Bacteriovorax sp. DB6_IX]|uniref:methyltransferase n=1 Tax=Bacteriovorax sp. DB6_IX TaxID=1353530 RepID=UPI00038A39B3|nr:methyltransferase [Bacteriovorax sp. DB6_IX]EQC51480.1 methyltransferase domain protein [Bacteriovorax sp. DB6_IX]